MINGLRLAGFLCITGLLVGCGPSATTQDVRTSIGAFNIVKQEIDSLKATIDNPNWQGQYNPIEDQVQSALSSLAKNEKVVGTPLEAEAKKLLELEAKAQQIYNSPDATREKVEEVVNEMVAVVEKMDSMM